jgi:hypothetical protein
VLAVTGFPDDANVGAHLVSGAYGFRVTYTAVPEPQAIILAALGVLLIARRRPRGALLSA